MKLDHLFNLFNSFSKISMVSPLLQGTMDNFLHCTLHFNIIWLPSVLLWIAILYWNVMKNVRSSPLYSEEKGKTFENLEKE